jgi:hypothetical protein
MRVLAGLLLILNVALLLLNLTERQPASKAVTPIYVKQRAATHIDGEMSEGRSAAFPSDIPLAQGSARAGGTPGWERLQPILLLNEVEPSAFETELPRSNPVQEERAAPVASSQDQAPGATREDGAQPHQRTGGCGRMGPFLVEQDAVRAAKFVETNGATARVKLDAIELTTGYSVMMPPLANAAAAKQEVARLKAAGVEDLWLVPRGELANSISLGVFDRAENAEDYARALRQKGFAAERRPRLSHKEARWVHFAGLTESAETAVRAAIAGAELERTECAR